MSTELRHRNLPQLMLQAREALMAQFRPILNDNGVTEQQWRIVRALLIDGPLEPRQLCERCQISSPSIVGVLARMEEAGLVERERMSDDQRRVRVSITARSRQLGRRIVPAVEERYGPVRSDWPCWGPFFCSTDGRTVHHNSALTMRQLDISRIRLSLTP